MQLFKGSNQVVKIQIKLFPNFVIFIENSIIPTFSTPFRLTEVDADTHIDVNVSLIFAIANRNI